MNFAAFESSTARCSVALSLEGELRSIECDAGNRAGEVMLPLLRTLLDSAGIAVGVLDAVAFGAGPGAFTGVRIACSLAQGIAAARDLPVIGVSTLEAIAEDSGADRVLVGLDARMGEVYCAAFERARQGGSWQNRMPSICAHPDAIVVPAGRGWFGCGGAFAAGGPLARSAIVEILAGVRPCAVPTAAAIARLAGPRLEAGEGVDAALAAPAYVRDKVALTNEEQKILRRVGRRSR